MIRGLRHQGCNHLNFTRANHVIDVGVFRERPDAPQGRVGDAGLYERFHPGAGEHALDFPGREESVPLMRSLRQPSEDILGADDCKQEGFHRSIERCDEQNPVRL